MTPPFLLGVALLFWGQQTGRWNVAITAAVAAEAFRFVQRRDLAAADFRRVSLLCTALLIAASVYAYVTEPLVSAVMTAVQWFPIACLPLVLAQRLHAPGRIPVLALLPLLSRRMGPRLASQTVDCVYPYVAACILAASAANSKTSIFYAGMLAMVTYALWPVRPRSASMALWGAAMVIAAGAGYAGHLGLHALQGDVERAFGDFVPGGGAAPSSSVRNTAIGAIGSLKLSGRIALRVAPETPRVPHLLHAAVFTSYAAGAWVAPANRFIALPPDSAGRSWQLGELGGAENRVRISASLSGGAAALPLPDRAARVEGLEGGVLRRDPLGSVEIDEAPSPSIYTVTYGTAAPPDGPPGNADLFVLPALRAVFAKTARDLTLDRLSAADKVQAVAAFFASGFTYTLDQPARPSGVEPLEYFMTQTHSGHCEYFATGAALLLRSAGVPTRYAVGYAVQEWSDREQAYLVRDRHAHAWTRVYVDGGWEDLDTTPASWASTEAAGASFWEPVNDWLSWQWHRLQSALPAAVRNWTRGARLVLMLAVSLTVLWMCRSIWLKRKAKNAASEPALPWAGADSDFYRIERLLAKAGFARRPAESPKHWLQRLEATAGAAIAIDPLRPLIELHYRLRFDPAGLPTEERAALRVLTQAWVSRHSHLLTTADRFLIATRRMLGRA